MAVKDTGVPDGEQKLMCQRCHETEATLMIRVDKVCQKCFLQYVSTKGVKRMETYRPKASNKTVPQRLLLPLSFGPSSMSLLHICNSQLQRQRDRMGRTSYELVIVHIIVNPENQVRELNTFEKVKAQFPQHTYVTANLEDALDLPNIDWTALNIAPPSSSSTPARSRLQTLLSAPPSATSRTDLINTLLNQLLISLAKSQTCTSILFGHSTTRLAEKVLVSTASGRGFSLPWQVRDGPSPYGVDFAYPMRDLLGKEIVTFSKHVEPSISDLIVYEDKKEVSASSKNTTIDDLMAQYFASVEENYPSIVANVVRTSSKLEAPLAKAGNSTCNLCGLPVEQGTDGIHGWGGDQRVGAREANAQLEIERHPNALLCYGCSRSMNG